MSALWRLESGNGSEGWLTTGATTMSSTIMASAKPPVKHIADHPHPRTTASFVLGCGTTGATTP